MADQPTVLLIEDELLIMEAMAEALREKGAAVLEAADAERALLLVTACGLPIDAVFTDLHFPQGMTGLEFLNRFRILRPGARIFVTSGRALSRDIQRQLNAGESFVEKPYDLFALAARLAHAAESVAARRAGDDHVPPMRLSARK
jgi:CheY-like chemotaxis protein